MKPALADFNRIPRLAHVKQSFPRPRIEDVQAAVRAELSKLFAPGSLPSGARVGVTVGSRGITNLAEIIKTVLDFLRDQGASPYIIPAMGSHGSATPEGQRHVIEHLGITEDYLGAPICAEIEVQSLGKTADGVEAFIAETALKGHGTLLVNRIKPHTDFEGSIESGLAKICAVGLGKQRGAEECHSHIFDIGLEAAVKSVAAEVIETGKILGGLAILENAYHETAGIAAVETDSLLEREKALLLEAKNLMGFLPVDQVDVLLCDQMGKNISGTGLDTNIIGRSVRGYLDNEAWRTSMPVIHRIVVERLTEGSDGNATGVGLVDFITEQFRAQIDYHSTNINTITASGPQLSKTPMVTRDTRQALATAIETCPPRPEGARVVYIRDTLKLDELYMSEAYLESLDSNERVEVLAAPAPLEFDSDGYLVSPFR